MIQKMLEQKLWRFNVGLPGEQGYYTIDPAFADKCYEIEGSRLFGRLGHPVWEAFRKQAEQWRKEKHSGKKPDNKLHKVQASQLRGDEPMQVVIDFVSILLSAYSGRAMEVFYGKPIQNRLHPMAEPTA